jgi:hypothetical protein
MTADKEKYRIAHLRAVKKYNAAHPEKVRVLHRAYYRKHHLEIMRKSAEYRKTEKCKAYQKAYQKARYRKLKEAL